MIQCNDRNTVYAYFRQVLGLHWSDDFRGVLYVPECYEGRLADPSHVAIAVGYDCFVGRTCCIHSVIPRPETVTKTIVRDTFAFPFNVCGCEAVLGLVDSTNAAALRFDKHLGFKEVHRIPNGGTEGDLIVLQMLRADCRWLRKALH